LFRAKVVHVKLMQTYLEEHQKEGKDNEEKNQSSKRFSLYGQR
jgi:hypothetical protein